VLEIASKVAVMYGNSIKQQLNDILSFYNIKHAHLTMEDCGALPFVISARVETAIRRAFGAGTLLPPYLPECGANCHYGSERERPRRSRLYLPGNEPKFFTNAGLHKPDGIILDLEDSVTPSEKDSARALVRNTLRVVDFYGSERMVRINQGVDGIADLDWIIPHNVHLVLIPKVESAGQVQEVDGRIQEICMEHGISEPVFLMPIIESALGTMNALEIAQASPNNVALTLGLEDYTADLGVQRTSTGNESFLLRSLIVNSARASGLQAIDTVFSDISDMNGLRTSVVEAKSLGFEGKGCIHPRQIPVVHQAFAPEPKEIEKAVKIVHAFDIASAQGLGVVALGSKMIDPPVVKRAIKVVQEAEQLGLLETGWRDKQ